MSEIFRIRRPCGALNSAGPLYVFMTRLYLCLLLKYCADPSPANLQLLLHIRGNTECAHLQMVHNSLNLLLI